MRLPGTPFGRLACAIAAVILTAGCSTASPIAPEDDASGLTRSNSSHQLPGTTTSTNDQNRTNGWAHFNVVDEGLGSVTLEFVTTRNFFSCFEYRVDGEPPIDPNNFNTDVFDGLWPYTCVHGNSPNAPATVQVMLSADALVEVRMVFGAEGDERFDWTPVYVQSGKEACKNGGWADFGFRNQGQCIRYVNTGKDSR